MGLIHPAVPSYGGDFLRIISSVYPGTDTAPRLGSVLLGVLYAFADGGIAGLIFGGQYKMFAGGTRAVLQLEAGSARLFRDLGEDVHQYCVCLAGSGGGLPNV